MAFLSEQELAALGFARLGKNVSISDKASICNPGRIAIGDHVRIDDFCVLSAGEGGIEIGDYIHVAVFCSLIGAGRIVLADFANLSSRVSVYSSNDDYSGEHLTNPTVPSRYTGVQHADVLIGRHVIIGSGSVLLPGVVIEEGCAVGALSLVNKDCTAFGIYAGTAARRIGERKRDLLELEKELRREQLDSDENRR
jgi:dTDP-4-amino-4,6-dideoxy-D-glucose acyltransferase